MNRIVASLCTIVAVALAPSHTTASPADVAAIDAQSKRLSAAYVRGDIDALVSVYASDGAAAPGGRDFIRGRDALHDLWALPPGRTILRHAAFPEAVRVDGDHAYDWGHYEGQGAQDGEPLPPFRGAYVIVWQRDADGVWRIAMDMWHALRGPARRIAVTFDDLPGTAPADAGCDADAVLATNRRLLDHAAEAGVPATGFVNEGKCADEPGVRERVFGAWLDAGHDLGNHTFSHTDLNAVPLDAYIADIERGETVTRRLLAERGRALRYFRHPLLHAGADDAKRAGLAAYLAEHDYTVAPVTIDNQEYVFEAVYRRAKANGDTATMQRVADAYVPYLASVVEYFEQRSEEVVGYEPAQVLLLHVNEINSDHFDRVAAMLAGRGYRFVTLDEALADPAYRLDDGYTGPRGLSWIHRWALGKGMETGAGEPREPDWLAELFRTYRAS